MKNDRYIVLLLLPLLLSGCDFFYSTVQYTGSEANPHLCVEARLATSPDGDNAQQKVHVSHSQFFLDSIHGALPLVEDAVVTARVNNGTEVRGKYITPVYDRYSGKIRSGGYYTLDLVLAAGDSVRLSVDHPVYGKAEAVQVCPAQQQLSVTVDSVSRYGEIYGRMHLCGYKGSPTDVVTYIPRVDKCRARLTYQRGTKTTTDTVIVYEADSVAAVMYSEHECFGMFQEQQTISDFYAGYTLTAPVATEEYEVPFIIDSHLFKGIVGKDLYIDWMYISIRTVVRTIEDYDYYTSLDRVLGKNNYVPPRSSENDENKSDVEMTLEDVIASIRMIFDEMGNVEGSQIYGNLDGIKDKEPIGCFSMINVYDHQIKVSTD